MQVTGVLLAIRDQPVKEIDRGRALRLVGLILVQHEPAVAADRGAVLAGRVDDGELTRRGAGELLRGRCRARRAGEHEDAILVLEPGLRHVCLQDIGELDIADGAGGLLDGRRYGGVSGRALANRPGYGLALPDLARPVRAHRRQEVGKDVGGAATVRTVDDADVLVWQTEAAVVSLQRGVIPFFDLAQEDPGNGFRRQLELAVRDTLQVVRERFSAERASELDDLVTATHGISFGAFERHIAGAKVHRLLRQLLNAGARADGLVIDRDLAEPLVVGKERGSIKGLRERRARTGKRGGRRGRDAGSTG